jgi:hypothetical protein
MSLRVLSFIADYRRIAHFRERRSTLDSRADGFSSTPAAGCVGGVPFGRFSRVLRVKRQTDLGVKLR